MKKSIYIKTKGFIILLTIFLLLTEFSFSQETVIYSQGFENNDGGFVASGNALWQWGTPTYWTNAHSGTKCIATNLAGNIDGGTSGYMTSPAIAIPSITSNQVVRVKFFANINIHMYRRGQFQVSHDGITWTVLAQYFATMQGIWDRYEFDISNYAGGNIYLRYYVNAYSGVTATPGFYIDDISITVYNKSGVSKLLTLEAQENPNGSCPWIFPWDGSEYVQDNDIYSVARFEAGEYVDYYKLSKPLVAQGNKYKFEIREIESEESFTDFVSLIAVDHADGVEIAPDNNGNIYAYTLANLITPVSAVSNVNTDVLNLVNTNDNSGFEAYSQSYVDVNFGNVDVSQGSRLLVKVKGFNDGTGPSMPYTEPPAIVVQYLDGNGVWTEAGRLKPRFDWSECVFDMSPYLPDYQGDIKIRLYCISHDQKYHIIDYYITSRNTKHHNNLQNFITQPF